VEQDYDASPFNAIPRVVLLLAAAIIGTELAFQAASAGYIGGAEGVGWRVAALNRLAFSPVLLERMIEAGLWVPDILVRLLSYPLVHLSFMHAAFVVVFVLALGKLVAESFNAFAFLAIFFGSAVAGAVAYTLILNDPVALVGGYPAAYGLIGSYSFVLWVGLGATGQNRLKAFQLIAALMTLQLAFGLFFGADNSWLADIAGFATGFCLSFLLVPGGIRRLRGLMQRR